MRDGDGDSSQFRIIDDIAAYGWHCAHAPAAGDFAPVSYSVGLFRTFKFPELAVLGLPSHLAQVLLQRAVNELRQGRPLNLPGATPALIRNAECMLVRVPLGAYSDQFDLCRWYYESQDFPLYQIVWPAANGRFPWDDSAPALLKTHQPVLGHSRPGH
jgi:hypothetical protein